MHQTNLKFNLEKMLKTGLKNKVSINEKTIIGFLMLGIAFFSVSSNIYAAPVVIDTGKGVGESPNNRSVELNFKSSSSDNLPRGGEQSVAIGNMVTAVAKQATAIGSDAHARGADSIAIGGDDTEEARGLLDESDYNLIKTLGS